MKLSLVVLNAGKSAGQVIPIQLAQFVIGRDPQCNLRPASALISKRHCALLVKENSAFLRDFESTNGTILNDEPVQGEVEIKNGDVVKIGPLEFRIALEASPAPLGSTTPTPTPASAKAPTPPPPSKSDLSQDDIGDMLLDQHNETGAAKEDSAVPDGSTVMDLPLPSEITQGAAAKPSEEKKKPAPPAGNAQSAAAALYAKLSKRPR